MVKTTNKPLKGGRHADNRLNLILAVIFFAASCTAVKLYGLQYVQYDFYTAIASEQQLFFSELAPARGRILITDKQDNGAEKLYPVAMNKEFATVYAVPKNVADPKGASEKIFEIFDMEKVKKDIDAKVEKEFAPGESDGSSLADNFDLSSTSAEKLDQYKNIKKELNVKILKEKIIDEYMAKLLKANDPYEPIKYKVEEDKLQKLQLAGLKGINFFLQKDRFYPEPELGGHLIGFVGNTSEAKMGQYGLEGYFDEELAGRPGSIKAEQSAGGDLVIINDREYKEAVNGSDLVLTINRSIQYTTCQKLKDAVIRHGADGGSVIVMEPKSGAILAMCSFPDYNPNEYGSVENINIYNNPAIFNQFEPGSVFKAITLAASLDQGKVKPETTYTDKGFVMIDGWPHPIKNSDFESKGGRGIVSMITVLEQSLNTGAIFAMQKTGEEVFADYVKKFGFGEKTGIELETESPGNIKRLLVKNIRPIEAATASFGQGITVTPLQMANAYAAIANGGILMKPYLVKEIVKANGEKIITQPREIRRVISEKTASLLGAMLAKVVENGHGKLAGVNGYYIAGKTGTAQVPKKGGGYEEYAHIGSFAGFGPVDDPAFVMLVKIDNPRDVEWAESSAAPLFGEIAQFILNYFQIPKER